MIINYIYILIGFFLMFIISTTILWKEVKKYYAHEREMARTNDMCISHVRMLSDLGIICGALSAISFIMMIAIWLEYTGVEWIVLQFNKLF